MARKPYTQLRMRMVECGVTQSEMAHELGVCGTFISERMLGKRPFDTDMIQAIGSMLNIQPEDYHKFFFEGSSARRDCKQEMRGKHNGHKSECF